MLRYRLVPIYVDDDPVYEGEDDSGNRFPVTAKSHHRASVRHLLKQHADRAPIDASSRLVGLIKRGCDRHRLHAWLLWLACPQPPLARKEVEQAAETIERAANQILNIQLSGVGRQIDPGGMFRGLPNVVSEYARRLHEVAPTSTGRDPVERDAVLASLVRHIKERTTEWRDEDVAVLVTAATGEEYTTEAHAKWRERHSDLLKRQTSMEQAWELELSRRTKEASRLRKEKLGRRWRWTTTALFAARQFYPEHFGP